MEAPVEQHALTRRDLLAETGTVWVHLDDAEAHRVRCLLDEIFGADAFIADLTVESNPKGRQLDRFFAGSHDRLMVYARDPEQVRLAGGVASAVDPADFPHRGIDGVSYRLLPLRNTNKRFNPRTTPTMTYPLYGDPGTGEVNADRAEVDARVLLPQRAQGRRELAHAARDDASPVECVEVGAGRYAVGVVGAAELEVDLR